MAGYSGAPLAKKLGIKPGRVVYFKNVPKSVITEIKSGEPSATVVSRLGANIDVALVCSTKGADLAKALDSIKPKLVQDGGLWLSWPKKSSGIATDVTETQVREMGLASGLVDNKVCAIDDTWSGLRFVIRVKDRKANPQ